MKKGYLKVRGKIIIIIIIIIIMRKTDMITQDECAWYIINFSPLLLYEMNRGNKWEFKFWS